MIKPIITNVIELRKKSIIIESNENISALIQDLKDTLTANGHGLALAAPQIGIFKQVCYIRIPTGVDPQNKSIVYREITAINPKIIEKDKKFIFKDEGCLSFPGLRLNTNRYLYCMVQYEDENRKSQLISAQNINSFVWQHECNHLDGKLIFDVKHRSK